MGAFLLIIGVLNASLAFAKTEIPNNPIIQLLPSVIEFGQEQPKPMPCPEYKLI